MFRKVKDVLAHSYTFVDLILFQEHQLTEILLQSVDPPSHQRTSIRWTFP